MNEHPLPEEGRITDKLPEAVAPLPPDTRIAIAPATGRLRLPVAMPRREEWPLPYEITRGGLLAIGAALLLSLCLLWYGSKPSTGCSQFLAVLAGSSLLGGALGAAIGHLFRDDKGGAAAMGAFVGALAGPPIVLILFLFALGMPD